MPRFKKGSKEAKAYMAKIRGKKTTAKKPVKKVAGLDKVVRKGKKTNVHYTRIASIGSIEKDLKIKQGIVVNKIAEYRGLIAKNKELLKYVKNSDVGRKSKLKKEVKNLEAMVKNAISLKNKLLKFK